MQTKGDGGNASKAAAEGAAGAPTAGAAAAEAEELADEGSFTLFVKNLNFETGEEALATAFRKRTKGVRAVSLPKKTAPAKKVGVAPSHCPRSSMAWGD